MKQKIISAMCALPIIAIIASAWHEQVRWQTNYAAAHSLFKQSMAQQRRDQKVARF